MPSSEAAWARSRSSSNLWNTTLTGSPVTVVGGESLCTDPRNPLESEATRLWNLSAGEYRADQMSFVLVSKFKIWGEKSRVLSFFDLMPPFWYPLSRFP